jgi:hypothetical protein
VKCSLIDEYVKKPSAHGMNTFNRSSVMDALRDRICEGGSVEKRIGGGCIKKRS